MKKLILGIIGLSLVLSFSSVALADNTTECGDPSLNNASSTITRIACGNGPINTIMPWGNEATMPKISAGQFVIDESGFKVWAPNFDYQAGWVDLTHTDYYRNQMRALAIQLNAGAILNQFPMFVGWLNK